MIYGTYLFHFSRPGLSHEPQIGAEISSHLPPLGRLRRSARARVDRPKRTRSTRGEASNPLDHRIHSNRTTGGTPRGMEEARQNPVRVGRP